MNQYAIPTNEEFRAESERFLPICASHCTCLNGWHFVWSAFKASGRRRSIYFQQPLLAKMLAPMAPKVRKILIAGAADAGILTVLASIFGSDVEYVGIDLCAAPLVAMRHYAVREGLSLRCERTALQEFVPQETFDLVFMHNTLMFLQPHEASEVLNKLRLALRPEAALVCGMRYEQHPKGLQGTDPVQFLTETRAMIQATYANHPELAQLVDAHLDEYAATHRLGRIYRYEPAPFEAILNAAGYVTVDRFTDDQTPAATLNMAAKNSDIRSDVFLLQTRSGVPAANHPYLYPY